MKISELYSYAPKSRIKAGQANPSGKYQFYASSPDEKRRCDNFLYDAPAIIMGTGGSATLHYYDGKFATSTDCLTLIPNEKVIPKYLYYFFLGNFDVLEAGFKGAGLKHTNKGYIDNIDIMELPSLDRQKEVVTLFDRLNLILTQRKKQIDELDTLTKARFVEMFGRRKNRRTLQELSIGKSGYGAASASVPYDSTRPRYVRITDINDNGTLNNDCVCSINKQDDINYKLKKGDFLFARMGATVGKTYYYRDGNQIYAGYLIRFKLDPEKLLPEYLYAYTQTDEYFDWVKLNQSGAAQPGINAHKYGSLQIPMASIKEQKEFVRFVSQVDKSKFVIQKSLEKTQMLFDSLMQEYFG